MSSVYISFIRSPLRLSFRRTGTMARGEASARDIHTVVRHGSGGSHSED